MSAATCASESGSERVLTRERGGRLQAIVKQKQVFGQGKPIEELHRARCSCLLVGREWCFVVMLTSEWR